ncbi:hypothetical protein M514_09758 [Trichuris suis]|uniref:Uncharacterized protein n=1 Tax=Trichuris suis TaxID=68888 RepID=A0A085N4Z2_9BILA|nr:hypothetical protein M513_09758 [Trichuris suis]KFD64538.1 hypothetical protein M514_09758 [Trichuris suis]
MLTVVGRFKRAVMKQNNSSEHCRSKTHKMDTGATASSANVPSTSHNPKAMMHQLSKNGKKQVDITESSLAKGRPGDNAVGNKRLQQSQQYLSLRPHQRTRQKANFRDDFGPPLSSSSSFSSSNEPYYPYPSPNKFPKTNPFFKTTIKCGQQARSGYVKLNCIPRETTPAVATVCPIVEESESTTTDSALTSSQTNSGSSESQESLASSNQRAQMKKIIAGLKSFGIKGELYVSMILNRGMLTISIDQARHLQPPAGSTSCNAYIRLTLMPDEEKRTQYKSEVVPGSNVPVFNLNVSLLVNDCQGHQRCARAKWCFCLLSEVLPEDDRKRVFISLWNRDAVTQKGGLLGCMAFSIRGLIETKQVEGWYYLLAPSYGRHKHLAVEKRAAAVPTVSSRPSPSPVTKARETTVRRSSVTLPEPKRQKLDGDLRKPAPFDYKTAKTCVATNFGVLAKVLDFLRKRHLEQATWSLSLQEIFEELQMFDVSNKVKMWLAEILPENSRISRDEFGKFIYKPPYRIKGKNSLLGVLKRREMEGSGALLMSELAECVSCPEKLVAALGNAVTSINVNVNKRKDVALFYNDTENLSLNVDEAYVSLWRSVNVGHLNDQRLEEYLVKHGIDSSKAFSANPRSRESYVPKRKSTKRSTVVHNEHLARSGLLMDFSERN